MLTFRVVVSFSTGHVLLAICKPMGIVAPQTTSYIDVVYRFFALQASNKKVTGVRRFDPSIHPIPIMQFTSTTSDTAKSMTESLDVLLLLCISNSDSSLYWKN
jgi:hypothetical protein